jgi:hypothetical protein
MIGFSNSQKYYILTFGSMEKLSKIFFKNHHFLIRNESNKGTLAKIKYVKNISNKAFKRQYKFLNVI